MIISLTVPVDCRTQKKREPKASARSTNTQSARTRTDDMTVAGKLRSPPRHRRFSGAYIFERVPEFILVFLCQSFMACIVANSGRLISNLRCPPSFLIFCKSFTPSQSNHWLMRLFPRVDPGSTDGSAGSFLTFLQYVLVKPTIFKTKSSNTKDLKFYLHVCALLAAQNES
jgi:hypothetical protein